MKSKHQVESELQHLQVDLEYSSREGHGKYWEKVNKKVNRLYNLLERIEKNGRRSK